MITQSDDLQWTAVLSGPGGLCEIPDEARAALCALEVAPGRALILRTRQASLQQLQQLRQTLQGLKYEVDIRECLPAILPGIYRVASHQHAHETTATGDQGMLGTDATRLFNQWLQLATDQGASDVHIEIRAHAARVRVRIDGRMVILVDHVDTELAKGALSNAYLLMADPDTRSAPEYSFTFERNCIIQAALQVNGQPRELRVRFESFDVSGGLDCILRIPNTARRMSLEEMGFAASQIAILTTVAQRRDGLLAVSGSTGSGKTTLLNALNRLDPERQGKKCYEIGDPIELTDPELSQISIKRSGSRAEQAAAAEHAFSEAARMVLRADPDKIILSEIRGRDVGDVVTAMVQTGHLVLATVHAGGMLDVVPRLASSAIGIPRQTLCSPRFLAAVSFQALLPRLCPACALPAAGRLPEAYLSLIQSTFALDAGDVRAIRVIHPDGCAHCRGRGTAGQTVAAEVSAMSRDLLELLRDGRDADADDCWRRKRLAGFADADMTGKTAFEHGLWKVLQGWVDPRHLEGAFETFPEYASKMVAPRGGNW